MRILNFGSLNVDETYRVDRFVQPGETKASLSMTRGAGGKGLNQSVALAMAGAEVFHAGLLGQGGAFLRRTLEDAGVDCGHLLQTDAPNGRAIIQLDAAGQNCILLYPGTNHLLTEDCVDRVLAHFSAGDVLLLQNETNLLPYLIEAGTARGLRVAFNAAPMTGDVRSYPLEKLRWLLVNETEGAALTGQTEPGRIAAAIAARCPETALVLTLGADGALYRHGELELFVPARRVQVVDTTAAGDTFTGFFLAAAAAGDDPAYALTLATAASAIAVTRPGAAASIPSLEEVLKSL